MAQAYHKSGHSAVVDYQKWKRFSKISYPADAHGTRFMNNYANDVAAADYGKWEAAGTMPEGSVIAKDSFIVTDDGKIQVGPLFFMEKGAVGSNAATRDWQYTKITPTGIVQRDAALQKFCNDCHNRAGAEDDNLMFLPLPFRISTTSGN
ncbi:MAG: cytochrome P460 family protein [Sneathiella sp.]|nr:cytochrome P460 family protein [Sneathiella sp.]